MAAPIVAVVALPMAATAANAPQATTPAPANRVRIYRHIITATLQPQYVPPPPDAATTTPPSAPPAAKRKRRSASNEEAHATHTAAAKAVVNDFGNGGGLLLRAQQEGYLEKAIVPT